jgi:hypothetical protein
MKQKKVNAIIERLKMILKKSWIICYYKGRKDQKRGENILTKKYSFRSVKEQ